MKVFVIFFISLYFVYIVNATPHPQNGYGDSDDGPFGGRWRRGGGQRGGGRYPGTGERGGGGGGGGEILPIDICELLEELLSTIQPLLGNCN